MAMEFVHDFATTEDPGKLAWMDDVVLLLMPSINPDGQVLVVDWYEKYLGTEYEGGRMPWLYQHYVGHDNNRDFYMLTQKETQVVNEVLYHRWFPQVFVDEHQMGSTGPRMFVPPQTDPLAPEVHSLIFRQADLIGTNMTLPARGGGQDRRRPQHDLRQLLARRHPQHGLVEERHRAAHRGRERPHRQRRSTSSRAS